MKENNIRRSIRTEVRIAKTLLIMVSVFTVSVLPTAVMTIRAHLYPSTDVTDMKSYRNMYKFLLLVYHICTVVLFYNSFWNYFIYQRRDKDFKKSFEKLKKRVLRKLCRSSKSEVVKRNMTYKTNSLLSRKTVVTDFKKVNDHLSAS